MPVPGPRTQSRPLPGYANPWGQEPERLNRWLRPAPVVRVGESPGTMQTVLRGHILAAGTVRRLWRQSIDYVGAQAAYSWTRGTPTPERPALTYPGYGITRALRYMTRSTYVRSGTDNTRLSELHTLVEPKVRSQPVSIGAGQSRSRPTIRNRLTSFGSRVQPLNSAPVPATQR